MLSQESVGARTFWFQCYSHAERYLLSQTNAAEAVGKEALSIFQFLQSNALKALLAKAPEFFNFAVQNAQKPRGQMSSDTETYAKDLMSNF